MAEAQGRRRASRQVLLASLWLALLILVVKVWIGWATQSLSLLAESLQTLVNGFSILLSTIAITSRYPASREVGGHGKVESVLALLLAALMGFACLSLLVVSAQQLEAIAQEASWLPVRVNSPLLQLLGVVIATNFCLACFQRYEAGLLENSALRFSAGHLFQDTWLMLPVLAGLVGVARGYLWLDPVLAMLLVLAAICNCWRVFNWQLPSVMRQIAIAPEALAQTIHQVEGITHCYGIQSRGVVGRQVFVEMRLILHPECLSIARSIAERVERAIRDRYGPVKVVIYIDSDRPKSD
ncbi:cation diffusion facilitator family transporter [Phormidium sp. FACHB-592]|uniref:Cation diffusion facilitator family transporter n=1 Tax=Stenomitos frigidus AS-A4 TaxID=2933935 RepID=A0ABV0KKE2_9CYAN|nr:MULTISPECIES: cation diffusion facilitator family transporter [Cyanophyceae]MBD2036055.1 cation diffusion facilitator family transporter [Leptolyngbya sp. FACHB-321]MBD2076946.1 cation diffusion facilitator family transporter [Phormidium sp. FACHB-592]